MQSQLAKSYNANKQSNQLSHQALNLASIFVIIPTGTQVRYRTQSSDISYHEKRYIFLFLEKGDHTSFAAAVCATRYGLTKHDSTVCKTEINQK